MEKHRICSLWPTIIITIALIVAVLALFWPQDRLTDMIYVQRFFDVTLPILAFGALIKYLTKRSGCCTGCTCGCHKNNCK